MHLQRRKVVARDRERNGAGLLTADDMYLPKAIGVKTTEALRRLVRAPTNATPPSPPLPAAEEETREMWASGVVVTSAAGWLIQMR